MSVVPPVDQAEGTEDKPTRNRGGEPFTKFLVATANKLAEMPPASRKRFMDALNLVLEEMSDGNGGGIPD